MVLKKKRSQLQHQIQKLQEELSWINDTIDQCTEYPICPVCKDRYILDEMRELTNTELDKLELYDEMMMENDSCYQRFEKDTLYCLSCIHDVKLITR